MKMRVAPQQLQQKPTPLPAFTVVVPPSPVAMAAATLASRIALVTGAASGLGRATAERIVRLGGRVAIVDLPTSDGANVAAAMGDNAIFCPADVTSEADVRVAAVCSLQFEVCSLRRRLWAVDLWCRAKRRASVGRLTGLHFFCRSRPHLTPWSPSSASSTLRSTVLASRGPSRCWAVRTSHTTLTSSRPPSW